MWRGKREARGSLREGFFMPLRWILLRVYLFWGMLHKVNMFVFLEFGIIGIIADFIAQLPLLSSTAKYSAFTQPTPSSTIGR